MSSWELFLDGLKLLVFGMGTVFAFLVLMVYCMKAMHTAIQPFIKIFETPAAPVPASAPAADTASIAAAVAAVELYRKNHK